jgi:hypothetical protein
VLEVPTVPATAHANLRRSLIVAACLGGLGLLVLALTGHVAMGLFGCLGLALGAFNTRLVQRSVVAFGSSEASNKKARFTRSVLGRLGAITLIAVACALLVRPDGLGVIVGLAVFQLLMVGSAVGPAFKELRQS